MGAVSRLGRAAALASLALLGVGCEVEQTPWPGGGGAGDGSVADGSGGAGGAGGMGGAALDAAMPEADAADPDVGSSLDAGRLDRGAFDEGPVDRGPIDMADMADLPDMARPDMARPDMEPPPEVYRWLIVLDDSIDENQAGTAGADICGLSAACGADELVGVDAELVLGDGRVCDGVPGGPCGDTRREDPRAALDDGAMCEGGSSPSDYVSLGVTGSLAVDFGRDLRGCTVYLVELAGRDAEGYAVYLCETPVLEAATCAGGGAPVAVVDVGGEASIDL